jgi:23S rRNA (uracil1939-C5)-methyltransferase
MTAVVAVRGIAAGGDGVGRLPDGRAIFLPRTAPGERVLVQTESVRVHRHFARGVAAEIVEPAVARVTPRCPHYVMDRCAGCQLQHLDYAAQLAAKRGIVGDSLRRIGKLDVADPEIEPAHALWQYRSRITLAVHHRPGRPPVVGLAAFDPPGHVFGLTDCLITEPRLMTLWHELQPHLDLLPPGCTRLTLGLDRSGIRHCIAESPGEPWRAADALRARLAERGELVCWWHPTRGAARVVAGPASGFAGTAFEAVNPAMEETARQWGADRLEPVRDRVVWDLYGGCGDMTRLLAVRGATVICVDADETAIRWGRRRDDLAPYAAQVRFLAARAEDVLPGLPDPAVVVVSPPPAGLHWDVTLRLTGSPVPQLLYRSQDPATLARDLRRLSVNYHVRTVRAFDSQPHTASVDTVAHLVSV